MEHDQQTVHYVTQDAMPNLKLRVTLTLLSAARPKPSNRGGDQAAGSSAQAGKAAETNPDTAAAAAAAAAARASTSGWPEAFKVVRTFSWQEKVYSNAELVAASQAHLQANKQQGRPASSPKRAAHFGSTTHIGVDRLLSSPPEGSVLFSYVQTDKFCERFEASRCITTSKWEGQNHLARKLATDARNRQKMLKFQSMCVMADLGDETTVAGSNEKVLCVLRAHHDGSFDMTPGFSTPAQRYRFEDDHGSIYEYTLELASQTSAPSLEKHTAKLAGVVAAQAEELRRQHNKDRLPVPGPDRNALRLLLLAELVSAAGFERDRLYIEWQLHFDPEQWVLQHSEQEVVQPGLIQGVTHVSQMVQYPADASVDTPPVWVAHFAHPIEVEWVARAVPAPRDWPRLLLQVCTYDLWDRMTTEGYGWLQLGPADSSGSCTHYVDTWKPLGSRRDQQQAYFTGGSQELQDMSYMAVPKDHKGTLLNKYGYKTQTSGNVKVRAHMVLQAGAAGGASPSKAAAKRATAAAAAARERRSLSLAVVLERARSRLEEACGGEVVVREGLLVQPPTITAQPLDAIVNEGATVQFNIKAVGLAPVRYQWFRDSKRLTVATSNTPLLVLVDVAAADSGTYHCQVTNKDGSVSSSRALLTVNRVGRLQAVTASMAEGAGGTPEPSSSAAIQGQPSSTLARRITVPRTLPVSGSPSLPFTTRLASAAGAVSNSPEGDSSTGGRGGTLSPPRTSLALGNRPLSAMGRPASAGPAGASAGGDSSPGRTRLNLPLRRFAASSRPSTAPAADGSVAAAAVEVQASPPAAPAVEAGASLISRSSSGRVSGGLFDTAEGPLACRSPRASAGTDTAAAAAAGNTVQDFSGSPGLQQQGSADLAAGVSDPGAVAGVRSRGAATGSPARLGSMRRTRVSEQE